MIEIQSPGYGFEEQHEIASLNISKIFNPIDKHQRIAKEISQFLEERK